MQYGICSLTIVPIRFEPSDKSEMVTQVLYGDHFKIIEEQKKWSKIRIAFDKYEGWIDNKQLHKLSESDYNSIDELEPKFSSNLIDYVITQQDQMQPITIGANLNACDILNHSFENSFYESNDNIRKGIANIALFLKNAPYFWGGKSPFGIDCSGFTQICYRLNGISLKRDASQQVTQGETLSFIEEAETGDLAFFDNSEGDIIHVGIILPHHKIIHAHGKVRIDYLDHTGIYNTETKKHTHKLRVIKKIV